jgi:hypothetical protein
MAFAFLMPCHILNINNLTVRVVYGLFYETRQSGRHVGPLTLVYIYQSHYTPLVYSLRVDARRLAVNPVNLRHMIACSCSAVCTTMHPKSLLSSLLRPIVRPILRALGM